MSARDEGRYAWLHLTCPELLSLLAGKTQIPALAPGGRAGDAEILAIERRYWRNSEGDSEIEIRVGLCSSLFASCLEGAEPPTLDWKPEPVADRPVKFREFF